LAERDPGRDPAFRSRLAGRPPRAGPTGTARLSDRGVTVPRRA
jgi:hypothetical protein